MQCDFVGQRIDERHGNAETAEECPSGPQKEISRKQYFYKLRGDDITVARFQRKMCGPRLSRPHW